MSSTIDFAVRAFSATVDVEGSDLGLYIDTEEVSESPPYYRVAGRLVIPSYDSYAINALNTYNLQSIDVTTAGMFSLDAMGENSVQAGCRLPGNQNTTLLLNTLNQTLLLKNLLTSLSDYTEIRAFSELIDSSNSSALATLSTASELAEIVASGTDLAIDAENLSQSSILTLKSAFDLAFSFRSYLKDYLSEQHLKSDLDRILALQTDEYNFNRLLGQALNLHNTYSPTLYPLSNVKREDLIYPGWSEGEWLPNLLHEQYDFQKLLQFYEDAEKTVTSYFSQNLVYLLNNLLYKSGGI